MAIEPLPFAKILLSLVKLGGGLWGKLLPIFGARGKEFNRLRDEFVDLNILARKYVEPHCQDWNPADHRHDDPLPSTGRQLALERLDFFFHSLRSLRKDGQHQMFILSDSGMGKTSLLLMIKHNHLKKIWLQDYGCELFKLGDNTLDQIAAISKKGQIVLLLDALDEDRQSWRRIPDRLQELLENTKDFRQVIISCRTQFFPETEPETIVSSDIRVVFGYHCPILYLSPFNDDQVNEFITKALPVHWTDRLFFRTNTILAQRQRAHNLTKQMDSLRMRPLLLSHIDILLETKSSGRWNGYTVYDFLVRRWLTTEERKLRKQNKNTDKVPSHKELLDACVHIAVWMEVHGVRLITEEQLDELIVKNHNITWLKGFNLGGRSLLNRNSNRVFRFSHYTIQEFLLAYALVNTIYRFLSPIRATDQLVRFIDLAKGFPDQFNHLDMTGFNLTGYVRTCGTPLSFRDKSCNNKGPEMLFISGGRLRTGKKQREEIEVASFAIGRYPITFEEFAAFCISIGRIQPHDAGWGRGRRPVINVSWEEAIAYCEWLSKETGQNYRLPTEDEWEYACRSGSKASYCFDDAEGYLDDYAWYKNNSDGKTHPVGEKLPNIWGLYDIHGNVYEWCSDLYSCKLNSLRVVRGGSCLDEASYCHCVFRDRFPPSDRYDFLGFRCVREFRYLELELDRTALTT